jgi:hypothetical protein
MSTSSSRSGASAPAQRQMRGRVEPAQQRQLERRHVGLRVDRGHGGEHAVVETALGIERGRQACRLHQVMHTLGQRGRARGVVVHRIGVGRKAAVVIQHGRLGVSLGGESRGLPVSRDHEHGLGRAADLARHVGQRGL